MSWPIHNARLPQKTQEALDNDGKSGHVKIFLNARKPSEMNILPWLNDEIGNKMLNLTAFLVDSFTR